jgi:hypothetical protein
MNSVEPAQQLFAEIQHVGARIDALESLRNVLTSTEIADAWRVARVLWGTTELEACSRRLPHEGQT